MSCARLEFRRVGDYRAFQPWVRVLDGQNGVYVIRDLAGQVLYIGESHRARLYDTMTRHFQEWSGRTAGPTYHRDRVEVAVCLLPADQAVDVQNALIIALRPLDNRQIPADLVAHETDDSNHAGELLGEDLADVPF